MIPAWAQEAVVSLLGAVTRLLIASNDDEREEALMVAAEVAKAALDRKKFGDG